MAFPFRISYPAVLVQLSLLKVSLLFFPSWILALVTSPSSALYPFVIFILSSFYSFRPLFFLSHFLESQRHNNTVGLDQSRASSSGNTASQGPASQRGSLQSIAVNILPWIFRFINFLTTKQWQFWTFCLWKYNITSCFPPYTNIGCCSILTTISSFHIDLYIDLFHLSLHFQPFALFSLHNQFQVHSILCRLIIQILTPGNVCNACITEESKSHFHEEDGKSVFSFHSTTVLSCGVPRSSPYKYILM